MEVTLLSRIRGANKYINQEDKSQYSHAHWARAMIQVMVKIGEEMESCIVLIDHGSKINIMSSDFYNREKWLI